MTKFQLFSDLHLEFGELYLPKKVDGVDTIVLAGDILTAHGIVNTKSKRRRYKEFFDHVTRYWKHVIYVMGNHEYYNYKRGSPGPVIAGFLAEYPNVYFLRDTHVKIDDTVFVGGTLWTDFFGGVDRYRYAVASALNDYYVTNLTTGITELWHHRTKDTIKTTAENNDKVVVVSHHAPSSLSSLPLYAGDPVNAGYYSNLDSFIEDHPSIKAWVHGHMHNSSYYRIGETRVIANPRGYPHELNKGFDETLVIEV